MHVLSKEQFELLSDKAQGYIDPHLLCDFKFGNQRGERKEFTSLRTSVKSQGVITPIIIRKSDTNTEQLEVISGHGRRDASIENKIAEIPFIFREVDDQTAFDIHMAENLDREGIDIIAKAHAYMRYLTQFRGDYEATASRLNVSVPKLRRLLELNKCADKVKDAIRDEKINFTASHGLVLAPFTKSVQEKNLVKAIEENWSVQELKKRSGRVKVELKTAKFDTSTCASCEHNTIHQMDLLSGMDDEAKCANIRCFQAKTTEYLTDKKAELTEQYGTILLLSETSSDNRQSVSNDIVGKAQFENCQSCENHVAVLDDRIGHEETISENQCVDKVCFTSCQTAHRLAMDEAKRAMESARNNANAMGSATGEKSLTPEIEASTTKVATMAPQLGNNMKVAYERFATASALDYFKNDSNFIHSMVTGALMAVTRAKVDGKAVVGFDQAVAIALNMSANERNALAVDIVSNQLAVDSQLKDSTMISLMQKSLCAKAEETIPMLTKAWMPTKSNLDIYTIKELGLLGKSAGLEMSMEQEEKGSFNKLMKSGKVNIVKSLGASKHDFSGFIPKSILKHIYPKALIDKLIGKTKQTHLAHNETQLEETTHD